jgi:ABC-type nitrate/sulfonate/bicarbonate transport system permease component
MGLRTKRLGYSALGLLLIGLLLATWEVAVRVGWLSQLALPLPTRVLQRGAQLALTSEFWSNWGRTLAVWITAFAAGTGAGLSLGFAAGVSGRTWLVLLPLLSYLRAIPPIALFPIALIAIGPGGLSVGIVAGLAAALYVFPGTAEAARESASRFRELASILSANKFEFLRHFVAPGAAVHALVSSRVSATIAFVVCVAGEMIIGGRTGVGAAVLDFSERYRLEEAYAYILSMGLFGLLIDLAFARVTRLRVVESASSQVPTEP